MSRARAARTRRKQPRLIGARITQQATPPYTMTCAGCGESWIPTPNRGGHLSDYALDKSAKAHWAECTPILTDPVGKSPQQGEAYPRSTPGRAGNTTKGTP